MDAVSDSLLHDLQRGEREAFVRYYEQYRAPVHDLVSRLLRDGEEAVSATQEVFTTAYRRLLLNDGPVDLRAWTLGAAIDVCRERLDQREADGDAAPSVATGDDRWEPSDLGGRFAQALESVEFRYQAALLLHDVHVLRLDQMATVFGVTEDAAGVLLFRAREAFRRAFEELSSDQSTATCRLAEQAAVGAVGRTLTHVEVRRLGEHAAFCRPCRRTMKGWGGDAIGLSLFLEAKPLPHALTTTPVFGTAVPIADTPTVVADVRLLAPSLTRIGRSLTSRAAAYALAAACLAVTVGLVAHQPQGDRAFVVVSGGGARVPLFVPSATSDDHSSGSRSDQTTETTTGTTPGASFATSTRSATGSSASSESRAAAIEPSLAAVADAGLSAADELSTVSDAARSNADRPRAATSPGKAKADANATKPGHGSAGPGRSGGGSGSHAEPARSQRSGAAKHATAHAKLHKDKKSKKTH